MRPGSYDTNGRAQSATRASTESSPSNPGIHHQRYPLIPFRRGIMKFVALPAVALTGATLAFAQDHTRSATSPVPAAAQPIMRLAASPQPAATPIAAPTARDADDFIAKVEADLAVEEEYSKRVSWIAATFITHDTQWLTA